MKTKTVQLEGNQEKTAVVAVVDLTEGILEVVMEDEVADVKVDAMAKESQVATDRMEGQAHVLVAVVVIEREEGVRGLLIVELLG